MSSVTWFLSFKLKKSTSVEEFLAASKRCHDEVLSQQKGFISWRVLRDGETWVDVVEWESAEDAKRAETAGGENPAALDFYSLINLNSCVLRTYSVEAVH